MEGAESVPKRASAEEHGVAPGSDGSGLVICPKTVRNSLTSINAGTPVDISALFGVNFPTKSDIDNALRWGEFSWNGKEGSIPQLHISPGVVRLTAPDLNRAEKRVNRLADSSSMPVENEPEKDGGEIRGWSRKSRSNMVFRLATLDYSDFLSGVETPAMVTLTYPGKWEKVAPDGATVKKHLTSFFKRFERAFGLAWQGVWKLEFQRRGAPHFHLFQTIPQVKAGFYRDSSGRGRKMLGEGLNFRAWLAITWADIVSAKGDDYKNHVLAGTGIDYAEGARARNPRSLAQYFSKHGSYSAKAYQNEVPELWRESGKSVGRFWGYRGLKPLVRGITITADESIKMARILRALGSRSTRWNGTTRKVETVKAVCRIKRARRTILRDGTIKTCFDDDGNPVDVLHYRWQTIPVKRMTGTALGGGYLCVTDGAKTASNLGRFLETCVHSDGSNPPVGLRGSAAERVRKNRS